MRRNGYLRASGQKCDFAIRSDEPRFTIRQMYFHYRVTFTDIFDVFVLLPRITL